MNFSLATGSFIVKSTPKSNYWKTLRKKLGEGRPGTIPRSQEQT